MAAGVTYEKLASYTVATSNTDASITFNSIPSGYTDLRIVGSGLLSNTSGQPRYTFNNDTTAKYYQIELSYRSSTTTIDSYAQFGNGYMNMTYHSTSSQQYGFIMDIMGYRDNAFKPILTKVACQDNGSTGVIAIGTHQYKSADAITSVTFTVSGVPTWYYQAGTTIAIYGIAAA
jgi:hypothetical protein